MSSFGYEMPAVLRALSEMDYDYAGGEGMDFEAFEEFLSAAETLLAGGFGPQEALEYPRCKRSPHVVFTDFATQHASRERVTAQDVILRARAEFPSFSEHVLAQCR